MAFYRYGLAFLAGTGFGAAMATVRHSRCPLHKRGESCCCRCRRLHRHAAAGEPSETGLEREECLDDAHAQGSVEGKKGKRCPKKDGEDKKGDRQTSMDKSEESG